MEWWNGHEWTMYMLSQIIIDQKPNRKQIKTKSVPITSPDIHLHEDDRIQVGKSDKKSRSTIQLQEIPGFHAMSLPNMQRNFHYRISNQNKPPAKVHRLRFRSQILSIILLCAASSKNPTAVEMQVVVLVRDNMETLAMRWRWLNPPRTNLPTAGPPAATESASALKKIFGNMRQ